jgi:hypothetical protein
MDTFLLVELTWTKGLSELYPSLGIPLSVCLSGVNYMYYKGNSTFLPV